MQTFQPVPFQLWRQAVTFSVVPQGDSMWRHLLHRRLMDRPCSWVSPKTWFCHQGDRARALVTSACLPRTFAAPVAVEDGFRGVANIVALDFAGIAGNNWLRGTGQRRQKLGPERSDRCSDVALAAMVVGQHACRRRTRDRWPPQPQEIAQPEGHSAPLPRTIRYRVSSVSPSDRYRRRCRRRDDFRCRRLRHHRQCCSSGIRVPPC